jgi:hypothetical protein
MLHAFRGLAVLGLVVILTALMAVAQDSGSQGVAQSYPSFTVRESFHYTTTPLRDMVRAGLQPADYAPGSPDKSWAEPATGSSPLALGILLNFDGRYYDEPCIRGPVGNGFPFPEPSEAVGITQYVQIAGFCGVVYDKGTGAVILGPWWPPFGSETFPGSDCYPEYWYITAAFDKLAQRWIFGMTGSMTEGVNSVSAYCVAVSTTPDATGPYDVYGFLLPAVVSVDDPKLGVWPVPFSGASGGAYLVSYRSCSVFMCNTGYVPMACALDRGAMLAGSTASAQCFQLASTAEPPLPADVDGGTAPPAGEPGLFMTYDSDGSHLDLYKLTPSFPSSGTFTGPTTIAVSSFTPYGTGTADIPQPSETLELDSVSDRPMYRLAYRNFGTKESLVFTHTVTGTSGSAGVRWYEINAPNGTPTVGQQGTFSPDAENRWLGSTAMDQFGDQVIGYSLTGTSPTAVDPSLSIAGRTPSDAAGQMEPEISVVNGSYVDGTAASYCDMGSGSNLACWGEHGAMQVDPVDDCTFWYTGEYMRDTSTWDTRIAKFAFPSCMANYNYTVAVSSSSSSTVWGQSVTFTATLRPNPGATGTVAFTENNQGVFTMLCAAAAVNSSGVATCTTTAVTPGTPAIVATYSGGGVAALIQTVSSQIMLNAGFETGTLASWTASTGGCSPIASTWKPHTGSYSAAEGATVHTTCGDGTVDLWQSVTIPSAATSASLTFWYWPKTDNTSYKTNYYALAIKNTDAVTLQNLLITASNAQTWTTRTYNLNAYIGQTIWIESAYYNNGSTHGGVYVDDFALNLQ